MVIVISGTDGALPAVVAGLVETPVVAVPTSVGYGAALQVSHNAAKAALLLVTALLWRHGFLCCNMVLDKSHGYRVALTLGIK